MQIMDHGNRSRSPIALLALCVALATGASMLYYEFVLFLPRAREITAAKGLGRGYSFGNDFYPVWLAARASLQTSSDPYSPEMTRAIQTGLFGRALDARIPSDPADLRMFAHPAFTILMMWPLAEMPFEVARVLLCTLLGLMTLASVFVWMRALGGATHPSRPTPLWLAVAVLFTLCSYPVLEGLYAGQLGLFVAFLLACCMLAVRHDRFTLAGMLLALTTIKPQMTLLAILYLLVWSLQDGRRLRLCLSFVVTMLTLAGGAWMVWPHWIQSWIGALNAYHQYARPPLVSEVLAAPLGAQAGSPEIYGITAALVIFCLWLIWRGRRALADSAQFWFTLALLLAVTTVILLPGQAVYDDILLLPGVLLVACCWRTLRADWAPKTLLAIGTGLLLWPGTASLTLIVLRPMLTPELFYSNAVFSLPLRSAAAFPFVVLGIL